MPAWLTIAAAKGFLGKHWPQIAILLAIAGAAWFLDHRGFERAKAEDHARELERAQITAAAVASIDGELDGKLRKIAGQLGVKIDSIDKEGKTIVQPIITRELLADPRLAAPDSCLTPGLLSAINAARGYPAGDVGRAARPANPRAVPGSPDGH